MFRCVSNNCAGKRGENQATLLAIRNEKRVCLRLCHCGFANCEKTQTLNKRCKRSSMTCIRKIKRTTMEQYE
jgi:hypothetical protein